MRPRSLFLGLSLAAASVLAPAAALACTPAPGYSIPTNLQLAEEANLILAGEVVGERIGTPSDPDALAIAVRPIAAIKGLMPGSDIAVGGMVLAPPGEADTPGDPLDFESAHPSAYTGACIRRMFPQGAQVLFFLERRDGDWVPAGGPFSRWAEDVEGEQDPWAQLALLYSHAAMMPEEEARVMLQEQYEALLVRQDEPAALAMARDIERSLAGPARPLVEPLPPPPEAYEAEGFEEVPEVEDVPEIFEEVPEVEEMPEAPAGIADVEAAIDAFGSDDRP